MGFLPVTQPQSSTRLLHPIRVAARRTGLSPHVLRAWERRYRVVTPGRSAGGQRLYSDLDLERLALLGRLVGGGHGISQLARLDRAQLQALAAEGLALPPTRTGGDLTPAAPVGEGPDDAVAAALASVLGFDADALQATLERAGLRLGVHGFLERVAAPLLRRIGDEWRAGRLSPAQEHQATVVMRRTLGRMLERVEGAGAAPRLLAATPAGERHELGALLAAATAAGDGWRVTYLGADLPAAELAEAAERTGAQAVALGVVLVEDGPALTREVAALRDRLRKDVPLLLGGPGAIALRETFERAGAEVISELAELRARLRLVGRPA